MDSFYQLKTYDIYTGPGGRRVVIRFNSTSVLPRVYMETPLDEDNGIGTELVTG